MISLNPQDLEGVYLQSILQNSVAPRPIGLVSTTDTQGNVNLSPFSFFNVFSSNPPILIFSPARRVRGNTTKHTLENVLQVPECVISVVNFSMVQQVSLASTEYELGVNEFEKSGLTMLKSELVKAPLVAESPVNFECKVLEVKALGDNGGAGNLVICEIVKIHIHDNQVDENKQLNPFSLDLVARLGGNWYSRVTVDSLFEVEKPIAKKGIGVDALPESIRLSNLFTGNELAQLANVESIHEGDYSNDAEKHREAKSLLANNKIKDAWELLLCKK